MLRGGGIGSADLKRGGGRERKGFECASASTRTAAARRLIGALAWFSPASGTAGGCSPRDYSDPCAGGVPDRARSRPSRHRMNAACPSRSASGGSPRPSATASEAVLPQLCRACAARSRREPPRPGRPPARASTPRPGSRPGPRRGARHHRAELGDPAAQRLVGHIDAAFEKQLLD